MNKHLSVIVLTDHDRPLDLSEFANLSVYTASRMNPAKPGIDIQHLNRMDGGTVESREIGTAWVLFLEEDEFLTRKEKQKLLDYCKKNEEKVTELVVERFLPDDNLTKYAWVSTRKIFEKPPKGIKRYFTSEMRLIPSSRLKDIRISRFPDIRDGHPYIIEMAAGHKNTVISRITISRKEDGKTNLNREYNRPDDKDIFKHGHQQFFKDEIFSQQFVWPHSVYHTIRLDYVPSILQALREGLSSPEIVFFTLIYLLRFAKFSETTEILRIIPEYWLYRSARSHDLLSIMATLHYINGDHERACRFFELALEQVPDDVVIAQNAIKINLLLGRYDACETIQQNLAIKTGQVSEDDFLNQFKVIHGGFPERTATVSLCMIIRNEAHHLERAILSAKPLVDEIIVVDTGSTDNSASIARSLGAMVHSFPWCDNFSAARNFAIERATCDYIFIMDGDEYIPPFYFLESQVLKKLLPLSYPYAFNISLGDYFNKTDWLFLIREVGNFRVETTSIRIFPRQAGVKYEGFIEESTTPSLGKLNIPVHTIPPNLFHIVHSPEDRHGRVKRKFDLYRREINPDQRLILAAIKDSSLLGDKSETLAWLKRFYAHETGEEAEKVKMGLHLANLLETAEPEHVESLYRNMIAIFPGNRTIEYAFAIYLLKNHRLDMIPQVPLDIKSEWSDGMQKERLEYLCFASLKCFMEEDMDASFRILNDILDENGFHVFAQCLRFYYLMRLNNIEAAISTLDLLFFSVEKQKEHKIEDISDFIRLIEEMCTYLSERGYHKERVLVLQGALSLEGIGGLK